MFNNLIIRLFDLYLFQVSESYPCKIYFEYKNYAIAPIMIQLNELMVGGSYYDQYLYFKRKYKNLLITLN